MNNRHPQRPKLPTIVALIVAFAGGPLFVLVSDKVFGPTPGIGIQVVLQLLYCGLAGFIVWVVVSQEHLPLRSIGWRRPNWVTCVTGALLGLFCFIGFPLITAPLVNLADDGGLQAGIQKLAALPIWFRLIVAVTGGIIEETLYRGYAVERLAMITGRAWVGGVISMIIFGLAHIPSWGVGFSLAADLPFGVVMTLFYLWRRDLLANIIAHSGTLVMAMLAID
jgi:membrane protease YdiL (CAAX protease family)